MSVSENVLQQVITYQESSLALLTNQNCFVSTCNSKFKNFQDEVANLGDTVSFDLPPRFTTVASQVAAFESVAQRVHQLTVDYPLSTSFAFNTTQFIFNVEDYMDKFGMSAIAEIGAQIESRVALNCETGPFRFYGDGRTPINSQYQLAAALAQFRTFGAPKTETKGYLLDTAVPAIINNNLAQFVPMRNEDEANSWEVGQFSRCDWYQSNLLPLHIAGTEGNEDSLLTVVSVTKDANDAVISITFSGTNAASDADSVKIYDKFQFQDGVAGFSNIRFRHFIGHTASQAPVQFKATANAASTGGSQVTVSISPPLQASAGKNQNITQEIQAGMQVRVLPNHRAGLITAGNPLYLAMPRLPDQTPYPSANKMDDETGVSIRLTYGTIFGQDIRGLIYDTIMGTTLVPEYGMTIAFPE